MDNRKIQRITIMDEMFSSGQWISFEQVTEVLDNIYGRILDPYFDGDMDRAYGSNFRSDIRIIRGILKDPKLNLDPDMLETCGSKRYMKYRYKTPGFRISPFLRYQYTVSDYKQLDRALKVLEDNLPDGVYNSIEFTIRSRVEYDFSKGEKSIDYNDNLMLRGRYWLPLLYKSINKTVLKITYCDFDGRSETYLFHPYLLKQFNQRWFVFGCRTDKGTAYWNVPLDRIENIVPLQDVGIIPRPKQYLEHFNNFIGVTNRPRYELKQESHIPVTIVLAFYNHRAWGRSITKPIHISQQIVKEFADGYGEISICVVPNNEMFMRILSLGEDLSIISPAYIRREMASILKNMNELYME